MVRNVLLAIGILTLVQWAHGTAYSAESATYSTGWIFLPRDTGFLVAQDKGWYKKVGLDIKLVRGYGGSAVAKDISAGAIELGHADRGRSSSFADREETFRPSASYMRKGCTPSIPSRGTGS